MEKIKYDGELMKTMALFESLTNARLKDCFVDHKGVLVFVVDEHQLSKAVGKQGATVRRLQGKLNRKIKILGFTPYIQDFVRNLVYPLQVKDVKVEDGVITITGVDTRTRAFLIGKNSQNLTSHLMVVKRYFTDVKDIKVV